MTPEPPRVTLGELARRLQLSRAAVSMALRAHPRIGADTRRRVEALARELDYRPDPEITRLTRYLRTGRGRVLGDVIAVINNFPTAAPWETNIHLNRLRNGLAASALDAGFKLEAFWMAAPEMTGPRLARILHTRGINGIVFLGLPHYTESLDFPFQEFATVAIGQSLAVAVHRTSADHFLEMKLALHRAHELGYRRPGLVLNRDIDRRTIGRYRGAFASFGGRTAQGTLLTNGSEAEFCTWLRSHRPDVVFLAQPPPAPEVVSRWIARHRVRGVGPAALALLDLKNPADGYAGILQNYEALAAAAIDVIVAQLFRGARGLPAQPKTVCIAGTWIDGPSVPARDL